MPPAPWVGALIAVQKVDVVAHSYGGILTRWYVEQSPEYAQRRDVRKIIELGTPNLGSPLANMVDEVVDSSRKSPIADATVHGYYGVPPFVTEKDLVGWVNDHGLPNTLTLNGVPTPREFYEDASVGSSAMNALSADPFNDDVGYAAVVGTYRLALLTDKAPIYADLYLALQPEVGDANYFPWIYQFDSAPSGTVSSGTDGVVPTWSASLGVTAYNFDVENDHVELVEDTTVQQQVISWLNDPNVPLGSAQRAAEAAAQTTNAPQSELNAYQGATTVDARGGLTGGGLNPNAIVGISFGSTGMNPVTFSTAPDDVGAKHAVLTGMIRVANILGAQFQIIGCPSYQGGTHAVLQSISKVSPSLFDTSATTTDTWVAFRLDIGRVGREDTQKLSGPDGATNAEKETQWIGYIMSIPGTSDIESPRTEIHLPQFSLPAPTVIGTHVTLNGAVEAQNSKAASQTVVVDLKAYRPYQFDALISADTLNVAHPLNTADDTEVWDGLLIPYSDSFNLWYDASGNVAGNYGDSGNPHPYIYQYLNEREGLPNPKSGPTGM